jgi:hypothetical protein
MEPKFRQYELLHIRRPIQVTRLDPNAEVPSKETLSDVYHDISVVKREDNRVDDVQNDANTFGTGLRIQPPRDYHIEIFEHPELYKAGYSLVGGVRFINPTDEGELILPLMKFKEGEDIELPFKVAVMVLRETQYANVALSSGKKTRNDGGSNNNNGNSAGNTNRPSGRGGRNQQYEEEEEEEPAPRRGGRSSSVHSKSQTRKSASRGNNMF